MKILTAVLAEFVRIMEIPENWNFTISFSRPGKSWDVDMGHGKAWKMTKIIFP